MNAAMDVPELLIGLVAGLTLGALHLTLLGRQVKRIRDPRRLAAGAVIRLGAVTGALAALAMLVDHPGQALAAALGGMTAARVVLMRRRLAAGGG